MNKLPIKEKKLNKIDILNFIDTEIESEGHPTKINTFMMKFEIK